jgi:hypothetical protein
MRLGRIAVVVGLALSIPALAAAQTEWVFDPVEPVLGPGEPGGWDAGFRYPLAVVEVDGTYHLFFNGQQEGVSGHFDTDIGHATSADGVSWELDPANPVLTRGAAGEWDEGGMWGVAVLYEGSEFHMWYMGCAEGICPAGYATSPDGTVWEKYPANPVMGVGGDGSFDSREVHPQTVIVEDDRYRMWYVGNAGPGDYSIGYAESDDGLSWEKHPGPVLAPSIGWEATSIYTASVIFDGMSYHLWYTGAIWGSHGGIGYAVSSDGIEWTRFFGNPVVEDPNVLGYEHARVLYNDDAGRHEMWVRHHTEDSVYRAVSDCCSTVYGFMIPAAAYAAGAEGSFYETALELNNAGSTAAEYFFSWLPRGETNTEPMESESFTLGPGMAVRYANVLADIFGLEPDAFGALMVETSSPDLLAMARIANTPQEKVAGTFGQSIPQISFGDFTGIRERRRLIFGTEHDDMRTNVGCVNADPRTAAVDFELFTADGTLLGTERLILMPWSNDQINRIFDAYRPVTGYVDYWSVAATGRIYCFGSVLDNVTSDPMTVPPM